MYGKKPKKVSEDTNVASILITKFKQVFKKYIFKIKSCKNVLSKIVIQKYLLFKWYSNLFSFHLPVKELDTLYIIFKNSKNLFDEANGAGKYG